MDKLSTRFDRIAMGVIIGLLVVGAIAELVVHDKHSKPVAHASNPQEVVSSSSTNSTSSSSTIPPLNSYPFSTATLTADTGGIKADHCVLLADTPERRAKGMTGRNDFGPYDAMVFKFDDDTTKEFFNYQVPVALTIAWFDSKGNYIDQNNMNPCKTEASKCPTFGPANPFRYAIEVLKGNLDSVNLRDGSSMALGGGCSRS